MRSRNWTRLAKRFPPGMKYQLAFDTTDAVGESIRDVLSTLLEAIVLVILVIFIFLQDWRTTVIPAVTIPVSLIGTFAFVKLLGFSINTLTLFGITLATGLVVDDAIVVIENIERHIQEGEARYPQGGFCCHGRSGGRGDCDVAGAGGCVRAGGVFPGNDRHSVPAVRADHCVLHLDLGLQRADAYAVAFRLAAGQDARRKECSSAGWIEVIGGITEGYRRALRSFLRFG